MEGNGGEGEEVEGNGGEKVEEKDVEEEGEDELIAMAYKGNLTTMQFNCKCGNPGSTTPTKPHPLIQFNHTHKSNIRSYEPFGTIC